MLTNAFELILLKRDGAPVFFLSSGKENTARAGVIFQAFNAATDVSLIAASERPLATVQMSYVPSLAFECTDGLLVPARWRHRFSQGPAEEILLNTLRLFRFGAP